MWDCVYQSSTGYRVIVNRGSHRGQSAQFMITDKMMEYRANNAFVSIQCNPDLDENRVKSKLSRQMVN